MEKVIESNRKFVPLWARVSAEFVGTYFVMFAVFAVGTLCSAIYGVNLVYILLVTAVAYAAVSHIFGSISGAYFNPAISVAAALTRRITVLDAFSYIIAQVSAATAAAGTVTAVLPISDSIKSTAWFAYIANGFEEGSPTHSALSSSGISFGLTMAVVLETVMTAIVVAAAIVNLKKDGTAKRGYAAATGCAYALGVGVAFPATGASLNPARSTGIAIFAQNKGLDAQPLSQLWLFWLTSVGAALLVAAVALFCDSFGKKEAEASNVSFEKDSVKNSNAEETSENAEESEGAEQSDENKQSDESGESDDESGKTGKDSK